MSLKFYNSEYTLVVCDEDACAIWSNDREVWKIGSVETARDCWITLPELTRAEAAKQFPKADFSRIPDLTEAEAKAEAGYVPLSAEELKRLGVSE